jgi:hypothetical protein
MRRSKEPPIAVTAVVHMWSAIRFEAAIVLKVAQDAETESILSEMNSAWHCSHPLTVQQRSENRPRVDRS